MESTDLRVFAAVASAGGMKRAAERLHTVQSNVTARIRKLEDGLGAQLFSRSSRGVALTPAGARLLPFAERMGRLLDDARRATLDDGTPTGRLVVGSLETTAALRLSPGLAGFASEHPAVDLVLETGTTEELIGAVLAHRLEGAFVCGPVDHPELDEKTVFREELVGVTAPGIGDLRALHTVADPKIVVLRAGCSYRQRLEDILAHRGVVGLRRLEFGTLDTILACVGAGIGVTLLPRVVVEAAARAGRVALHTLPPAEAMVDTVFIRRHDGYASSALQAFVAGVAGTAEDRDRAA